MPKTLFPGIGADLMPEFVQSIYGANAAGGHVHDGVDADGHCGKVNLTGDVTGVLPAANMASIIQSGTFAVTLVGYDIATIVQCDYTKYSNKIVQLSIPRLATGGISNVSNFGATWLQTGLPNLLPSNHVIVPAAFQVGSTFDDYVLGGCQIGSGGGMDFFISKIVGSVVKLDYVGWPTSGIKKICQQTLTYLASG